MAKREEMKIGKARERKSENKGRDMLDQMKET